MNTHPPSANGAVSDNLEVIVVGGGQAGLAIGYFLRQQGRDFVILEAAEEPAAAWRERWDSLKLFTPAALRRPARACPSRAIRTAIPTRDEVAAYLTDTRGTSTCPSRWAATFASVRRAERRYLRRARRPRLRSRSGRGRHRARSRCRSSRRSPTDLGPDVVQFHSTALPSAAGLPDGRVLVVGGGNTGFQIAEELSASREVHLSIGSRQTPLPQRILGRDLFWYLDKTGLIRKSTDTRIGRRLQQAETR